MGIALTAEQVAALAPDAASASAGKKLASPRSWQNLGQHDAALWGQCQGSALYDVAVDRGDFTVTCTCPSHKFPCKHGLGLLFMAAATPAALPSGDPPDRVTHWLAERQAKAEARAAKAEALAAQATAPLSAEQQKRAEKRTEKKVSRTAQGLEALDRWMADLIRNGLAGIEAQPATFWEHQAKRLVDAQAPGLAAYIRTLSEIPGASPDWAGRLLVRLGRAALLTQAFRHLDDLDPPLQEELRQIIGWTSTTDDVSAHGTLVEDEWLIVGQWIESDELRPQMRTQRTWLLGTRTGRPALHLQFSALGAPFAEILVPTTRFRGALRFWPGAAPVRARIEARQADGVSSITEPLPGAPTIEAFLDQMVDLLARQPWQPQRRLCVLRRVTPACLAEGAQWWLQDSQGDALPLAGDDHWRLLAISGGRPVDVAGEWDGETVRPLGALADGRYCLLGGAL